MELKKGDDDSAKPVAPAVLAALVDNHRRFLAFLQKRVGTRGDAEDILQEAFARGLARAGEIRDEERAVAWFYRLLRNAVVDHWRTRAARDRGNQALARETIAEAAPDPEVEGEICRCFEALLPTLKPEYAEMLRAVDLGGRRPVEVAADQGLTPNAAMVTLHRARRALRARLEQSCRTCATHGCLDCTCGGPSSKGPDQKTL
jgi:RNA polymerase sigma-70 factor (ECF subfamily)